MTTTPLSNGDTCTVCFQGTVSRRANSRVVCSACKESFPLKQLPPIDENAHVERVNKQQADELWSYRAITLHKNVFTKITKG